MASVFERERRNVMITKALLLGYSIEEEGRGKDGTLWYNLRLPDGYWLLHEGLPEAFRARWLAAKKALIHAGEKDATKPRRDTGVGSGKSYRLRQRRRDRRRVEGEPEGLGAGSRGSKP